MHFPSCRPRDRSGHPTPVALLRAVNLHRMVRSRDVRLWIDDDGRDVVKTDDGAASGPASATGSAGVAQWIRFRAAAAATGAPTRDSPSTSPRVRRPPCWRPNRGTPRRMPGISCNLLEFRLHAIRSPGNDRDQRSHWSGRGSRRDGEDGQRRAGRQGIHRRRLRDRQTPGPRRRGASASSCQYTSFPARTPRSKRFFPSATKTPKGSILEPHSRTEPASVRVVPLDGGCAPTGPTLAVLSERTCRAPHSHVHRPSKFSKNRSTRCPRANWAHGTVSRGARSTGDRRCGDFLTL